MSIQIATEKTFSLLQATDLIPRRRRGRKTALTTLYRWSTEGVRGVRLETLQIGGTRCTSLEALQRFFDELSAQKFQPGIATKTPNISERLDQANRQLSKIWK